MDDVTTAKAQQASAVALTTSMNAPQTKTQAKSYYMPFNGSRFIMPSGKALVFAEGCLMTDIQEEIDEIEKAISSGAEISRVPMLVVRSDALPLREVGASSKVAPQRTSGVGMANSQTIAALAAESSSKK